MDADRRTTLGDGRRYMRVGLPSLTALGAICALAAGCGPWLVRGTIVGAGLQTGGEPGMHVAADIRPPRSRLSIGAVAVGKTVASQFGLAAGYNWSDEVRSLRTGQSYNCGAFTSLYATWGIPELACRARYAPAVTASFNVGYGGSDRDPIEVVAWLSAKAEWRIFWALSPAVEIDYGSLGYNVTASLNLGGWYALGSARSPVEFQDSDVRVRR